MKTPPNPRIAVHTAKLDLSRLVLSPITYKYLSIFNKIRPTKQHIKPTKSITIEELINGCKKHRLTPDDLLKNFASIPHRNKNKVTEIIPNIHLSFRLLWTQLALLLSSSQENKPIYQVVVNIPDQLLERAKKSAQNKKNKTTVIRELMRLVFKKLPNDIEFWAVFELGRKLDGAHIHIMVPLDYITQQKLRAALSRFGSVKFQDHTKIYDEKVPIDLGAAYYYAKSMNNRYNGSNNLYVTPALIIRAKAVELHYRDFITDNKPFLLNDEKAIKRSIDAYEQSRIDAVPKNYDEWEEKVMNQPTEVLDVTVYWEEIQDDPLSSLDT